MKKRNIPFGYQWENGIITARPAESKIVAQIFASYIAGRSLLQIAEALNKNSIEYLSGVVGWNKARLKRMIEDARYLGTKSFPAIVEQTAFDKAQTIKFDRNTQKDIDRMAEIRTLPVPVCCEACGSAMHRLHDSRTSHQEKWVCQSCGAAIKITDTDLLSAITDRLNDLLADPEQVHYTPAAHESPVELLRLKNEIGRMLDGSMTDKELLKNKIFEYASRQYAELDADERIAMEIRAALSDTGPLSSYSAELTKAIVTSITLHADKSVTFTLKNGQQVRKERSDGAHEHSA